MNFDILVGTILTAMALVAVVTLTLWSRSIIERLHARSPASLREIKEDIETFAKPAENVFFVTFGIKILQIPKDII